jgi:hypothetical protein
MSFKFGLANDLDPSISLYCFLCVVFFLIFFEYLSGVIEFFLEKSPLYNRILQLIYKELMLMGLVSFAVIMYGATQNHDSEHDSSHDTSHNDDSHSENSHDSSGNNTSHASPSYDSTHSHNWLQSLLETNYTSSHNDTSHDNSTDHSDTTHVEDDYYSSSETSLSRSEQVNLAVSFAHILLFFLTLCFVVLAFYLLWMSIFHEKNYHQLAGEEIISLKKKVENIYKNPFFKFLFLLIFWPFSSVRNHIEFHLLNDLFHKHYLLSLNFNFASYLSLCFGRFALKTINRSLLTWFVFIVILLINYFRIVDGKYICATKHIVYDPLSKNEMSCGNFTARLFIFSGILVSIFFVVLLLVSRIYKFR